MNLLSPVKSDKSVALEKSIKLRIDRGRARMEEQASMRRLCIEFYRGNQYGWVDGKSLYDQRTGSVGSGNAGSRNRHRVHQVRNLIKPIVDEKVSSATQRVPSYEVTPTTSDHEDIGAARLAEKVSLAGFTLWNVRSAIKDVVWYALVADEGFVYPYFDPTVGPYVFDEETGKTIGMGEIKLRTFGGNEAYWEPGCRFEDSRWHVIENARPKVDLEDDPDFIGGPLKSDAKERSGSTSNNSKRSGGTELVLVTEYFERPCAKYPEGRHITIANDRVIFPEAPFPVRDEQGNVVDEPPFFRLAYTVDPDSDRDSGIVRHLLDGNRTVNDAVNKTLEWMRLSMNPQILAPKGSLLTMPSDAPGDVIFFEPAIVALAGGQMPQWRDVGQPPGELFEIADRAAQDMRSISHANDITAGSVSSGSEVSQIVENNQLAWASFMTDLADLHAGLMRRCLMLTQRFYTEPRLLRFRGRMGWETIDDFRGADLRGQTDVRVTVGSIEPRTRRAVEQKVMNLAQLFPGYFPPEVIMSALDGGTADKLIDTYEMDVARVSAVIKKIRAGTLLADGYRPVFPNEQFVDPEAINPETGEPLTNPDTGEPVYLEEVPAWLPRPFDGIPVHKATMEDWMKTQDYEALAPDQKEQAHMYYSALLDLEARAAQRAAELQMQQAQDMGMANATRPPQEPQGGSAPALPE